MEIHIFSNSKTIEKVFTGVKKAKDIGLVYKPASQLKKSAKTAPKNSLVYADISSFPKAEAAQALKFLLKLEDRLTGIIDPKGSIADVAGLFHDGAADYLGSDCMKNGLTTKRLARILEYKKVEKDESAELAKKKYISSGSDWKSVRVGQEYTFCFMLVELENKSELKSLSPEDFGRITGAFRTYLEDTVAPLHGKIWMWMDFGGLILFPFDGKKIKAIEAAFRLMISRKLMSAEIVHLDMSLSFRIAMHIGNTVYKTRGDTGTIISDSINSVFHLGQKFAEPGGFYLTNDIFIYTPAGIMNLFVPAGDYEGRSILRMKRIL